MSIEMDDSAFTQFQEEFQGITSSLARKLTAMESGAADPETHDQVLSECQADVNDGKNAIRNIESDMRHWSYERKTQATNILKQLNTDFSAQQKQLVALQNATKKAGAMPEGMSRSQKQKWKEDRRRLLATKQVVDDTSSSLDRTIGILEETTQTGAATTIKLEEQREQLINIRQQVRETDDYLTKSRKTLKRMGRRIVTNKLIQYFIILMELAIIAFIVWYRFFS